MVRQARVSGAVFGLLIGVLLLSAVVPPAGSPPIERAGDPDVVGVHVVFAGQCYLNGHLLKPPRTWVARVDGVTVDGFIVFETLEGMASSRTGLTVWLAIWPRIEGPVVSPQLIDDYFEEWLQKITADLSRDRIVLIREGLTPYTVPDSVTAQADELIWRIRHGHTIDSLAVKRQGLEPVLAYASFLVNPEPLRRYR